MNSSDHSDTYDYDAPSRSRWTTPTVALIVFLLAALVFLDPFGWHHVDERLRGQPYLAGVTATARVTPDETLYTCPMHPEIIEDEPGSCPICGMDLVAMDDHAVADHADHADHALHQHTEQDPGEDEDPLYTCPMHPEILQQEPGSCPICGMDLVPADHRDGDLPEGPAVSIDPQVVQNMNVRIEPVRRRAIRRDLHAVGYLEVDPKRRVTVTTKTSGWVERVYVHYVGEPVRTGQPLFEVYAPDLVQTQRELLSAQRYAESLAGAPEDTRRRARELVQATRTRLEYWDVPNDAVENLLATGEVVRTVTVRSPANGLVTRRLDGLEGMAVKPGLDIFEIADLSSLWLTVELYEDQVAWIDVGSRAQIELSYFPGEEFSGTVRFIEPELRAETRTLGIRIEVPNPQDGQGGRLRAGMYAEVQLHPPAVENALTVPSQAVLRTGERNLVVTALGDGRFQPREVLLGHEGDGFVQIVSGVGEDDRVVTSAQFLIDSESNLRAAIEQLRAGHVH
ncbi:MAG: efflux RND transporter periplasmic adaptor subunit [Thermoanaerobaculia bacterium]|nr:efflux RND transporter periplasmic adaptor subunit [Thermoanaerobaculia bacterium]